MIADNDKKLLAEVPEGVEVAAAAKTRTAAEVEETIRAGIGIVGENYVQEALSVRAEVVSPAQWHFIGHLQTNKAKKAVEVFDLIETVDSLHLAREIDRHCRKLGKMMPILIEVNSGREPQKNGVLPEEAVRLIREISSLPSVRVKGLMTMGPFSGDPELARPFFAVTRGLFEELKALDLPNVEMRYLSMGMSNSYRVAIEEGANLIRVGTLIFGPRE